MSTENPIIKFECPGCGQPMEGDAELEFQKVTCPACGNEFSPKPTKFSAEEKPPISAQTPPAKTVLPKPMQQASKQENPRRDNSQNNGGANKDLRPLLISLNCFAACCIALGVLITVKLFQIQSVTPPSNFDFKVISEDAGYADNVYGCNYLENELQIAGLDGWDLRGITLTGGKRPQFLFILSKPNSYVYAGEYGYLLQQSITNQSKYFQTSLNEVK